MGSVHSICLKDYILSVNRRIRELPDPIRVLVQYSYQITVARTRTRTFTRLGRAETYYTLSKSSGLATRTRTVQYSYCSDYSIP